MVWLSLVSFVLIVIYCYLFIRRFHLDKIAITGLFLKIFAGFCLGLIYMYYYEGGDTFQYFRDAETLANYFLHHPLDFLNIYFDTNQVKGLSGKIVYHMQPRALLFAKIVSIFYLFTGGNYWLMSAFFSLLNFSCIYFLVIELNKKFPKVKMAGTYSFYFLPTFVFWTSGLLKESLAIGALALAIAIVIRGTRMNGKVHFSLWVIWIISLWLLWELKYYYAAIAIPLLVALLIYEFVLIRFSLKPVFILFLFFAGILFVSTLHYNLNFSRVLHVIYENYQRGIQDLENQGIQYYSFKGGWFGFLLNSPLALFNGLFRPVIFEANNLMQWIVGIENTVVFCFMIFGLWKSNLRITFKDPWIIAAMLYVTALSIFIAFTTPNFGTLSRYKAGYWPIFVLLVLALIFMNKKGRVLSEPGLKK